MVIKRVQLPCSVGGRANARKELNSAAGREVWLMYTELKWRTALVEIAGQRIEEVERGRERRWKRGNVESRGFAYNESSAIGSPAYWYFFFFSG